ncbi:MAG: hypothetical protein JW751_05750 [Polyangiaceae bacterium]|nr:hypothetical protein [Polyangiaceae bacterium]
MADPSIALPGPTPEDGEDVVLALETAATLWKRGDKQDAIRWLRRAAESAEEAGDDMRALSLARTAADLTSSGERRGSPPLAAEKAPGAQPQNPDAVVTAALQSRTGHRPFPAPPPPPGASRPPPPSASRPPPTTSGPPFVGTPTARMPPVAERVPTPATPPSQGSAPKSTPQASRGPRSPATDALSDLMRADIAPTKPKATSPTALGALRVSVRRSPDDPQVLMARLLGPEDPAPKGEKNAMLIATEIIIDQLVPSE